MNLQRKKSICVYCAHRDGAKPSYLQAAQDTGEMIARHSMRLVYGAGSVGLWEKWQILHNQAMQKFWCYTRTFTRTRDWQR